ncbi:TniQ family protein [Paraburkholderia youngii]|uniref:TniQ family protein n=1 Tax=Paraburkholderia youngii TaxID=2782701 RepID=UPI003D20CA84
MTIFLPDQLDEEPLFGIVARYLKTPRTLLPAVLEHVFGYQMPYGKMPFNLNRVEEATRVCWGLTAKDIAERMTGYPYFAALAVDKTPAQILEAISSRRQRADATYLGRVRFGPNSSQRRFCNSCFQLDRRNDLPIHWRRVHQLPGVCICPWHHELLYVVLRGTAYKRGFIDAADFRSFDAERIGLKLSSSNFEACLKVSLLSQWILSNRVVINPELFKHQLFSFIKDKSLGGILLSSNRAFISAIVSHYGTSYLRWVTSRREGRPVKSGEFALLEQSLIRGQMSSLRMVLYASACNAMSVFSLDSGSTVIDLPMGVRPSVDCIYSAEATRTNHSVVVGRKSYGRYEATCACGVRFTFSRWENRKPVDVKLTSRLNGRSEEWIKHIFELHSNGMSYRQIGAMFGIGESAVGHVLHKARTRSRDVETQTVPK